MPANSASPQRIPRPPPTSSSTAGRDRRPGPDPGADGTDKWFGTVMAAGFDSLVTDRANRMRWPHGRMRYNLAMLAELSKLRLLPFRLVLDGGDEIVTDLTLAAFGNTRSYGGGMLICPDADHTDGLLDITMVHVGVAHQAGPAVPHRVQGHPRRPRRGARRRGPRRSRSSPRASTPTPTASSSARCRSRCRRCRGALTDPAAARASRRPRLSQLTSRAVAAVAVGLERLVPCGAQHRVQLGGQRVGAGGHQRRAAASRRP